MIYLCTYLFIEIYKIVWKLWNIKNKGKYIYGFLLHFLNKC